MNMTALFKTIQPGWSAELELEFSAGYGTTVLSRNRHVGPLRLQRPLYPEGSVCHGYILHPPGGVVGGDRLALDIRVKAQAAAMVTTPGATRFYRSSGARATQNQHLQVAKGGCLEWFPQESIFFPGADTAVSTRVTLAEGARFMGWDILCLGLPACGQGFETGRLRAAFDIERENRPLFRDRLRIAGPADLDRPAGLRGLAVWATFMATGAKAGMGALLRPFLPQSAQSFTAVTRMGDLLVARYLGHSTAEARAVFSDLWTWLRPEVFDRQACPPRIWAT